MPEKELVVSFNMLVVTKGKKTMLKNEEDPVHYPK